jgi:hypothetical protein
VWLRLLHRSTHLLEPRDCLSPEKGKLGSRYAGPFQILECVGTVAYWLQLPDATHLHNMFHVGLLKPFHGDPPTTTPPMPPTHDSRLLPAPERVLHAQVRRD